MRDNVQKLKADMKNNAKQLNEELKQNIDTDAK